MSSVAGSSTILYSVGMVPMRTQTTDLSKRQWKTAYVYSLFKNAGTSGTGLGGPPVVRVRARESDIEPWL